MLSDFLRSRTVSSLALSLPLAFFSPHAAASAGVAAGDLASLLPSDTILYFSLPDIERAEKRCGNLPLFKLGREEEWKTFVEKPLSYAKEKGFPAMWKRIQEVGGPDLSFLEGFRLRSLDFALTSFKLEQWDKERASGSSLTPGIVLSIGCGEFAPKLEALTRSLIEECKEPNYAIQEEKIGDTSVRLYTPVKNPEGHRTVDPTVAWYVKDGRLVFCLEQNAELCRGFLSQLLGKGRGPTLAQDKDYKAAMGKVGGEESEVKFFLRVGEPTAKLFSQLHQIFKRDEKAEESQIVIFNPAAIVKMIESVVDALGIKEIRAIACASTPQDSHSLNQSYILTSGAQKGLLGFLSTKPVDMALLAKIPKEAGGFSVGGIRVDALWEALWSGVRAFGEDKHKKVSEMLAAFETQVGVNLKKDLVDSLGETMICYSMPLQNLMMATPELYFLLEVRDRERLEKSLTGLGKFAAEKAGLQFKENQFEGGKTYSISLVGLAGEISPLRQLFTQVSPSFAFTDKFLVAGMTRVGVKKALKRLASAEGEGAMGLPDFARFAPQIPKDACWLSYDDLRPIFTVVYQTIQMFGPMVASQAPVELPLDFAQLPAATTMTKHFFGQVSYSQFDGTGWYGRAFSPIGVDDLIGLASFARVVAAASFGIAAEIEGKGEPREPGEEGEEEMGDEPGKPLVPPAPAGPSERARQDLLDLRSGLTVYKIESGKYPDSLGELLKTNPNYPDGYLPGRRALPHDPWDHPYVYEVDAEKKSYKLRSLGPDGKDDEGKGDDIVGN